MVNAGLLMKDHIYTAIVLGSLVEGETTAVLAGYAAHQGYAPWLLVTTAVATVNFFWDQLYFLLGLHYGVRLTGRFPRLKSGVERVAPMIHRNRRAIVFGMRFMYGLRTAGPLALGIAKIRWREFVLINFLGAVVWAALFSGLGYLFGRAIALVIAEAAKYEAAVLAVVILCGLGYWVWRRLREPAGAARALQPVTKQPDR